jgi:hypothetical protein
MEGIWLIEVDKDGVASCFSGMVSETGYVTELHYADLNDQLIEIEIMCYSWNFAH